MLAYALPILYALFVWWFSTGVIMYVDGLPRHTFRWTMLGATAILAVALYGLSASSSDTTLPGAYVSFTSGLLVFGWLEVSFYTGFITGSRRDRCAHGCSGWQHFGHGIQAVIHHELAIVAAAAAVVALTWGGENQIGTWTFMALWWMHQSAKLNVFLGVRNLNAEFLPDHLQYLTSFFSRRPMNLLFPVSVTVSTVVTAMLVQNAMLPEIALFDRAGYVFLATLMALAVLEHWFLVLPLPAAALWNWSLLSRETKAVPDETTNLLTTTVLGRGR